MTKAITNKIAYSAKNPCAAPHGVFCTQEKHINIVFASKCLMCEGGKEQDGIHSQGPMPPHGVFCT